MARTHAITMLGLFLFSSITGICAAADPTASSSAASAKALLTRALVANSDQEVVMLTVSYPPGGSSPPHRHDAQVFVYMLEGEVEMQAKGGPLVILRPGDTFY